jgi:hypothetical protein
MDSNKKFHNLHKSKRCFIIGNGPSIKGMNLELLKNEIVFSVNNIMNNKEVYNAIRSDYHILIDPLYAKLDISLQEDLDQIKLLEEINYLDKKPILITDYESFDSFDLYGLNKILNIHYLYQHNNILDSYHSVKRMSRNFPSSQNVIQCAMFSAIDMGFEKIFLIGCDMTSFLSAYEFNADGERMILENNHIYKYSESDLKMIIKDSNKYDNEFILDEYSRNFRIFKKINKYANKNNISIYNAGIGGGLDVFTRVNYESIFDF